MEEASSPLGRLFWPISLCAILKRNAFLTDNNARPSIWFRYVDHTFTLFDSKKQRLNNCHANIKFPVEFEEKKKEVQSLTGTFLSNATVMLSQHLFTERWNS